MFPNTFKKIGKYSFLNCAHLGEVDLTTSAVESICAHAFAGRRKLKTVRFPRTLETIGTKAFGRDVLLREVDLSNTGVRIIKRCTFAGCYKLKTARFPRTLETIGEKAFKKCDLKEMILFDGVVVAHNTFDASALEKMVFLGLHGQIQGFLPINNRTMLRSETVLVNGLPIKPLPVWD